MNETLIKKMHIRRLNDDVKIRIPPMEMKIQLNSVKRWVEATKFHNKHSICLKKKLVLGTLCLISSTCS